MILWPCLFLKETTKTQKISSSVYFLVRVKTPEHASHHNHDHQRVGLLQGRPLLNTPQPRPYDVTWQILGYSFCEKASRQIQHRQRRGFEPNVALTSADVENLCRTRMCSMCEINSTHALPRHSKRYFPLARQRKEIHCSFSVCVGGEKSSTSLGI